MDVRSCGEQGLSARGIGAQAEFPVRSIARSPERAKISCAFLLILTYMDAGHPPAIKSVERNCADERVSSLPTNKRLQQLSTRQDSAYWACQSFK